MLEFHPTSQQEVADCIREAQSCKTRLEVVSGGSKRTFGRPVEADALLFLDALHAVESETSAELEPFPQAGLLDPALLQWATGYHPDEMALTAGPGTPLAALLDHVKSEGWQLPFEPPDLGPVLGQPAGRGTLGGAMACNLAGPRALAVGDAREHCLALEAVDGRGRLIRSDPRHTRDPLAHTHLLPGSFGTLAVFTSLTVRLTPVSAQIDTLVLQGLYDDTTALRLLAAILHDPFAITGATYLPPGAAVAGTPLPRLHDGAGLHDGGGLLLLRLEGTGRQVAQRCRQLEALLARYGVVHVLEGGCAEPVWEAIGNVTPFAGTPDILWRITLPPDSAAAVVASVRQRWPGEAYYDRGGRLVWITLASPGLEDGGESTVREAVAGLARTEAVMVRAPHAVRRRFSPFPPQSEGQAALTRARKQEFDPAGILNPGRFYPEL